MNLRVCLFLDTHSAIGAATVVFAGSGTYFSPGSTWRTSYLHHLNHITKKTWPANMAA